AESAASILLRVFLEVEAEENLAIAVRIELRQNGPDDGGAVLLHEIVHGGRPDGFRRRREPRLDRAAGAGLAKVLDDERAGEAGYEPRQPPGLPNRACPDFLERRRQHVLAQVLDDRPVAARARDDHLHAVAI